MGRLVLFVALIVAYHFIRSAPQLSVVNYKDRKGLEASNLYGIAQDSSGYIWIGSNRGLYKFDGNHFENFGKESGIYSHLISRVFVLEDNSLLLLGEQPSVLYQFKNNRATPILSDKDLRLKGTSMTQGVREGTLYFGGTLNNGIRGLYKLQNDSITLLGDILGRESVQLFNPEPGKLFCVFGKKRGVYQWSGNSFQRIFNDQFENEKVLSILKTDSNNLRIATSTGLYKQKGNGLWEKTIRFQFPEDTKLIQSQVDHEGKIWLLTFLGEVYRLNESKSEVTNISNEIGLKNFQATCIFNDQFGNHWISSHGGGLFCVYKGSFINYTTKDGLAGNYITELLINSENKLFVGSNVGLSVLEDTRSHRRSCMGIKRTLPTRNRH